MAVNARATEEKKEEQKEAPVPDAGVQAKNDFDQASELSKESIRQGIKAKNDEKDAEKPSIYGPGQDVLKYAASIFGPAFGNDHASFNTAMDQVTRVFSGLVDPGAINPIFERFKTNGTFQDIVEDVRATNADRRKKDRRQKFITEFESGPLAAIDLNIITAQATGQRTSEADFKLSRALLIASVPDLYGQYDSWYQSQYPSALSQRDPITGVRESVGVEDYYNDKSIFSLAQFFAEGNPAFIFGVRPDVPSWSGNIQETYDAVFAGLQQTSQKLTQEGALREVYHSSLDTAFSALNSFINNNPQLPFALRSSLLSGLNRITSNQSYHDASMLQGASLGEDPILHAQTQATSALSLAFADTPYSSLITSGDIIGSINRIQGQITADQRATGFPPAAQEIIKLRIAAGDLPADFLEKNPNLISETIAESQKSGLTMESILSSKLNTAAASVAEQKKTEEDLRKSVQNFQLHAPLSFANAISPQAKAVLSNKEYLAEIARQAQERGVDPQTVLEEVLAPYEEAEKKNQQGFTDVITRVATTMGAEMGATALPGGRVAGGMGRGGASGVAYDVNSTPGGTQFGRFLALSSKDSELAERLYAQGQSVDDVMRQAGGDRQAFASMLSKYEADRKYEAENPVEEEPPKPKLLVKP